MNISVFIGRRLSFKGGGDDNGTSASSGSSAGVPIAVGGIALALLIMMVSVAVVMGFKDEIRRKVTGFHSEITVYPQSRTLSSTETLTLTPELENLIKTTLPDARYAGVVEIPGILKTADAFQGVMVKAYGPGADGHDFIAEHITEGEMPQSPEQNDTAAVAPVPEIVISAVTASRLGLAKGDKVDMHFVADGTLRTRRATVSGIYDTHLGEYDSRFVFADPSMVRRVAKISGYNSYTSLEINNVAEDDILPASTELSSSLLDLSANTGGRTMYAVDNVIRSGQAYFSWLDLLDTNVVVILVLMALVSGFTLISSLFILILERVRTIGILKSLGATNGQIRGVFIYMAERLVARGLVIGNLLGLAFLFIQSKLHLIPLDADAYFLSYVPVDIDWAAIIILNLSVIVISAAILVLPSHMIATLSPSESMRYE